jgi:hypothetical protein
MLVVDLRRVLMSNEIEKKMQAMEAMTDLKTKVSVDVPRDRSGCFEMHRLRGRAAESRLHEHCTAA